MKPHLMRFRCSAVYYPLQTLATTYGVAEELKYPVRLEQVP